MRFIQMNLTASAVRRVVRVQGRWLCCAFAFLLLVTLFAGVDAATDGYRVTNDNRDLSICGNDWRWGQCSSMDCASWNGWIGSDGCPAYTSRQECENQHHCYPYPLCTNNFTIQKSCNIYDFTVKCNWGITPHAYDCGIRLEGYCRWKSDSGYEPHCYCEKLMSSGLSCSDVIEYPDCETSNP